MREIDKPFLMPVEDVFSITGRGTVATGRIERGKIKVRRGSRSWSASTPTRRRSSRASRCSASCSTTGEAGDNVGLLLRGVDKKDIERGMVLAKPGSITPHTKFEAEVYVLHEGRGRTPHAVLQGLPSAVLLPHDGRDGLDRAAGGHGDGDAGRQRADDDRADHADRDGRGSCASPSARVDGRSAPAS